MRSKGHVSLFLAILATVLSPLCLGATTYYLAPPPKGDDTNPGSLESPWATLQHAADDGSAWRLGIPAGW